MFLAQVIHVVNRRQHVDITTLLRSRQIQQAESFSSALMSDPVTQQRIIAVDCAAADRTLVRGCVERLILMLWLDEGMLV